jgi:endonuclease/exonuclease/phosphatase family metal-dependent hydrolase
MKLLSINTGIQIDNSKEIVAYIKKNDAEFVALQEVANPMENSVYQLFRSREKIANNLPQYKYSSWGPLWKSKGILIRDHIHTDFGGLIEQGNLLLSKYRITEESNEHYYGTYQYKNDWSNWEKDDHGRAVLIAEFDIKGKPLQILNVHGIWTKDKKGDERTIDQCKYIVTASQRKNIPTIIAGDFNLLPTTESISIINSEFRNLIDEYKIESTRPSFKDGIDKGNQVVDYIFVNDGIKVNSLQVPNIKISDHLPLILDFEMV